MCTISARIINTTLGVSLSWVWNRAPSSVEETTELQQLVQKLSGIKCVDKKDRWIWGLDPHGIFSVAIIKHHVISANRSPPSTIFKWNNWTPKKVGIVGWRAMVERLPTRNALQLKGIHAASTTCPLCNEVPETSEHLFVSCQFAQMVWTVISQWCKIPNFFIFGIMDLVQINELVSGSPKKRKRYMPLHLCTFRVFGG
ncbi:putative reverse transcriptase zinc-binding domain-containing protein [Helianthus annuus]|nr:putative reverse transcriptase zinc-binding domain-containing protein [Helianthus annuus]